MTEEQKQDRYNKILDYYNGDELASQVLIDKYLMDNENHPSDMWKRLASAAANIEREYGEQTANSIDSRVKHWYNEFYNLLDDWKFIPGGRINYALGRDEKVTAMNCYVIPIRETIDWERWYIDTDEKFELIDYSNAFDDSVLNKYKIPADSLEGIYTWLKESAVVFRSTGGVGTSLDVLRPEGMPVKNSGGFSPGPCSFMNLMSESTHTVHQKLRRGALMLTMSVQNPSILSFINVKKILGKIDYVNEEDKKNRNNLYKLVEHANISVMITDEFMKAVENDTDFVQKWPIDSDNPKIIKIVKARDIWDELIRNAHEHAEPGILLIDNHRRNDALWYCNPAISVNPCGEQFLGAFSACDLGHMNLSKYVYITGINVAGIEKHKFNFDSFFKDVKIAVRFLDNVIDWNKGKHALPQQEETVLNERRIGLGITGLADCLIRLEIKYDSEEALKFTEEVMKTFRNSAYETSVELAKEKKSFLLFNFEKWSKSEFVQRWIEDHSTNCGIESNIVATLKEFGIRNSFLTTVAPVGTGSIICRNGCEEKNNMTVGVSSGIEPLFAKSYARRVRQADGETFKEFKTYPGVIKELFEDYSKLPDYVITSHDIDPFYRVKLQSVVQRYIDNSISSTVSLKNDIPVAIVDQIYRQAWKDGLKSITVYREGSREGVLISDEFKNKGLKTEKEFNEKMRIMKDNTEELDKIVQTLEAANSSDEILSGIESKMLEEMNKVAENLIENSKPLDTDIQQAVNKEFWNLLDTEKKVVTKPEKKKKRDRVLKGETYKIPCDPDRNLYITINSFTDNPNRPFEIFVNSHGKDDTDVKTISILLSALMRRTEDMTFIINHLKKIESPNQGVWWYDCNDNRHYMNSVSKAISVALDMFVSRKKVNNLTEKDIDAIKSDISNKNLTCYSSEEITDEEEKKNIKNYLAKLDEKTTIILNYLDCPKCYTKSLKLENGCSVCISCGYSKCS